MPKDLRATQLRTGQLIATGSSSTVPLVFVGTGVTDGSGAVTAGTLAGAGSDVFLFVSGAISGRGQATNGISAFGGDLLVSGTIYDASGNPYSTTAASVVSYFSSTTNGSIFTTGSLAVRGDLSSVDSPSDIGSNVFFFVSGSISGSGTNDKRAVFGGDVVTSGSFTQGRTNSAKGIYSHAEGWNNLASGNYSHAEGVSTIASGLYSHAEGDDTTASGTGSHAEGDRSTATGDYSHAEGLLGNATNAYSHAEGYASTASGEGSHSEGWFTIAAADYSHAAGRESIASGSYSYAGGQGTITSGSFQHAIGKFNERNNNFSLFIVGGGSGTSNASRADILRVNSGSSLGNGRVEVTGSLTALALEVGGGYGSTGTTIDNAGNINADANVRAAKYEIGGSSAAITSSDGQQVVLFSGGGSFINIVPGSAGLRLGNSTGPTAVSGSSVRFGGTNFPPIPPADTFLFVSGSRGTVTSKGADLSVFGGDAGVSGSLLLLSNNGFGLVTLASTDLIVRNRVLGGTFVAGVNTSAGNTVNFLDVRPNGAAVNTKIAFMPGIYAGPANPFTATDTNFFVGGTAGSRGGSTGGTSVFGGDLLVSGSTYIGNSGANTVYFAARLGSDIIPDGNRTRNLGSDTERFANIFTGDLHLKNERGDWTIVEEPDFLCVVNNLTGQKFKMMLQPL